jgi:hypothetical protein
MEKRGKYGEERGKWRREGNDERGGHTHTHTQREREREREKERERRERERCGIW